MTTPEPSFVAGVWAVTLRNLRVWRSVALASVAGNFGEPILYLVALGYGLGRVIPELGGMSYAEFIAPGLVISTVMYTATFEQTYGSYTRLSTQAVWSAILATPITVGQLTAGELVWGSIKSAVGAASVLAVIAAFGLVPSWLALLVVPLGFFSGLLFAAMALVVTCMSAGYEFFNYYFTLIVAPMFLFGGIFFPLDEMPSWVATGAQLMPLTHVVALARGLVRGVIGAPFWLHLLAFAGFTVVACAAAALAVRRRLRS